MTDPFVEYVQNPDRRRLSRFIVAYSEPVTRLVRRIVPCTDASQDLVQDVFLRLAESDLTAEKVPYPRAYVFRVALNLAREHLRAEKTRARHESEAARLKTTTSQPAEDDLIAREAVERLYRNIDSLPEPLRVAIHLRAVDGLSYREIALVTGVSVGVVGSRIQKARQKLERLSGGRELAMAWANFELARKQAWFPAATDGLSRSALARLKKAAKPARTMIGPAAIVAVVTLAALGVSTPWVSQGPGDEATRSGEAAAALRERRGVQVSSAVPSVATIERREKPMAPVVAGAETGTGSARGSEAEAAAEEPAEPPPREDEGGDPMMGKRTLLASAALAIGMAGVVAGADTGDVNGDGRISFADAFQLGHYLLAVYDGAPDTELFLPVADSADFSGLFDCSNLTGDEFEGLRMPDLLHREGLRRLADTPLPHFVEVWPDRDVEQAPPPAPNSDVVVEVNTAEITGTNGAFELGVFVTTSVELAGIQLVLRGDGLDLRPPKTTREFEFGKLGTSAEYYLLTGGLLVYHSNYEFDHEISVGEHELRLPAELPAGTLPGDYTIEIVDAEAVRPNGEVIRPEVFSGSLTILEEIETGPTFPFPPIEFVDGEERRIGGLAELRVVTAEGVPGDDVEVTVQLRTSRPVNWIPFRLAFDGQILGLNEVGNPDGPPAPLNAAPVANIANRFPGDDNRGNLDFVFSLIPTRYKPQQSPWKGGEAQPNLDYVTPLGEWIDLVRLFFTIRDGAAGHGSTPLVLRRTVRSPFQPVFKPYVDSMLLWGGCAPGSPRFWKHQTVLHSSELTILGGGAPEPISPPIPPEIAQIHFDLGDAQGYPGDIVRVGVHFESEIDIFKLRHVLSFDSEQVELVGFELAASHSDGSPFRTEINFERPVFSGESKCDESFNCGFGDPEFAFFYNANRGDEVPQDVAIVDVWRRRAVARPDLLDPPGEALFWRAGSRYEIGALLLRIHADAASGTTQVEGVEAEWRKQDYVSAIRSETSGYPADIELDAPRSDVPAIRVTPGTVTILAPFVRGDADGSGGVNLTDPVYSLNHLFASGPAPSCRDAADGNDDGVFDLTDPVYTLNFLFSQGARPPPPPFPEAGRDPTDDELDCLGF